MVSQGSETKIYRKQNALAATFWCPSFGGLLSVASPFNPTTIRVKVKADSQGSVDRPFVVVQENQRSWPNESYLR